MYFLLSYAYTLTLIMYRERERKGEKKREPNCLLHVVVDVDYTNQNWFAVSHLLFVTAGNTKFTAGNIIHISGSTKIMLPLK